MQAPNIELTPFFFKRITVARCIWILEGRVAHVRVHMPRDYDTHETGEVWNEKPSLLGWSSPA